MHLLKPATALVPAGLLALVLTACSAEFSMGGGYDFEELAEKIQRAQQEETPDLEVTDPSCPDDDEPEVGATIECTVVIDGVEAPYAVTFTAVDDDGAEVDFEPAQAIVSTEKTVELIATEFEEQGFPGVAVDCGDAAVVVGDPGTVFTCDVTRDGSSPIEATVTIEDVGGRVSFVA